MVSKAAWSGAKNPFAPPHAIKCAYILRYLFAETLSMPLLLGVHRLIIATFLVAALALGYLAPVTSSGVFAADAYDSEPLQQMSIAEGAESDKTMRFQEISADQSGIQFASRLDLDHPMKRLYHSGFACGGVAVGDVDGDKRPDIYFVSGPHGNRLYRQSNDFQFEDVSDKAQIDGGDAWGAAAAMVDIDDDGDLDIYVCNYDSPNQLYLNDGTGGFREGAAEFKLDLVDACLLPAFCDYDRDGDLDLYLLTNRYYRAGGRPQKPPFEMRAGQPRVLKEFQKYYGLIHKGGSKYDMENVGRSDYLLRNDGDGTFSDVSAEARITQRGHGLSATWWDFNHDGWPDVYVGNDFNDPDHLYRNNRDGTFTDVLEASIPHTSWFSMGADFGDLNGDGRFDLLVADMSATTHYSQKTTMGAMSAAKLALVAGPPPQIMKNALYINSGTDRFFEAAELAGLADSDWTWSIKLADFDNDRHCDVFISNGMARSFNNSDRPLETHNLIGQTEWEYYEDQPPRPEQNLAYRNMGDLQFVDVSTDWGLDKLSMSYASAYADLDRDGDLDLVIVNLEEPVSVYRNDSTQGNRLLVALRGNESNHYGIGSTVEIKTAAGKQIRMLSPQTGFLSGNDPLLHFGLGEDSKIERLTVSWPNGQIQTLTNVRANQFITINEPVRSDPARTDVAESDARQDSATWYQATDLGVSLRHVDIEYDDFARQPLLPNKLSQLGPGIAVADYDGDGDDDFFVGGASRYAGKLMVNQGNGRLRWRKLPALEADKACEDMGAVWLDADSDGDLDLYVVSGGVEADPGHEVYRDRLYLQGSDGELIAASEDALPDLRDSGSSVAAADFDRDGDLDLMVGSRVIPGNYPSSPTSRLLENQEGKFVDATQELAPSLLNAGLVTSCVWSDADGDGWLDLLLTTEWGPVQLLHNDQGKLVDRTAEAALSERTGWWNGIVARDLDADGDIDYVVTNFGLNTKYHASAEKPALLYYGDFDGTGIKQLVEAEFEDDTLFPIRGKSCSTRAMPHLADKFNTYHDFALASVVDIYTPGCINDSEKFSATTLESGTLINDGNGKFEFRPLPRIAQVAPGFGAVMTEVNGDGYPDLYLAQNFFTAQPETGRMDGGMSLLLLGNGDGSFRTVTPDQSGLVVTGDASAIVECDLDGDFVSDLVVGVNNSDVHAFKNQGLAPATTNNQIAQIELKYAAGNPQGVGAQVTVRSTGGLTQTAEVCAGQGYLSQSSHVLSFGISSGHQIEAIEVRWPDGERTTHQPVRGRRQVLSRENL